MKKILTEEENGGDEEGDGEIVTMKMMIIILLDWNFKMSQSSEIKKVHNFQWKWRRGKSRAKNDPDEGDRWRVNKDFFSNEDNLHLRLIMSRISIFSVFSSKNT